MQKILNGIKMTRPYLDYCIFGALLMLGPWLITATEWFRFAWLTTIAGFIAFAIASLGKNILMGYGGLASLGTAGFMGVGAYMTIILTVDFGMSFFPVLIITIAFTMLLGIIVGLLSLRVQGFFLAIATLVIAEIFRQVFMQWDVFGGHGGRSLIVDGLQRYPQLLGDGLNRAIDYGGALHYTILYDSFLHGNLDRNQTYYLLVIGLVLAMMLTYRIFKSPAGRAMSAMSGSESAAAAMGINIFRYRLVTFAIATGFAGAAGSLYASFMRFTNPIEWTLIASLFIFAAVIIGGARSVAGTILGAFIVFAVPTLFLANIPVIGDVNGLDFVFTGVLIILVVMFSPSGLIYLWWSAWYKFRAWVIKLLKGVA